MSKKILFLILLPMLLFAQIAQKAPVKMEELPSGTEGKYTKVAGVPFTEANYMPVDLMPNVYGPAIGALNPAAYDPATGTAMIVHRGDISYAAGSGELWYNYSTDNGVTWNRSATSVNGINSQILGRYPSAAILNPTGSSNIADVMGVFAWPELNADPVQFQHIGFAGDLGLDGVDFAGITNNGSPTSTPFYSSQVPVWNHIDFNSNGYVMWAADNQDNAGITIWTTTDYSDIQMYEAFPSSDFGDNGNITLGGVSHNGVAYYGVMGSFAEGFVGDGGWGIGFSKSSNNGASWEAWNVVDWTQISATAEFTGLWDYKKNDGFISYQGDINVDKDGYVHIVTGLTKIDTNVSFEYGENALVEFFETANGWDAKIILEGDLLTDSTFTQHEGVALGQMGPSVYLAFDESREFMVAQWVTHDGNAPYFCDIYMAYRGLNDTEWSAPMNLTNTPNENENSSHLAPSLATVGNGHYNAFSYYFYPEGFTGGFDPPLTDPTVIYNAAVDIFATPSNVTPIGDAIIDANNDFIPDNLGQEFTIQGVVLSTNIQASSDRFSYHIADETGGLIITKGSEPGGGPSYNFGDKIIVTGTLDQYAGATQLALDADQLAGIQLVSTGNEVTPMVLTIEDYLADAEGYQGMYIKVENVNKSPDSDPWPEPGSWANLTIEQNGSTLLLRIDNDTELDESPEPMWPADISGVAGQFTFSSPPNDGYQLAPHFISEFVPAGVTPIGEAIIDANNDFIPDNLGMEFTIQGVVLSTNIQASSDRFSYHIADETGGLVITKGSEPGGGPSYNFGDKLIVTGTLDQYSGATQLALDADQLAGIQLVSTSNEVVPMILTIEEYLANAEGYQGMYIKVENVNKTPDSDPWPEPGSWSNLTIEQNGYTVVLRIDNDTELDESPEPSWPSNISGVAGQFTFSSPPNDGYQIAPHYITEFEPAGFSSQIAVDAGWNILSVPLVEDDMTVSGLFSSLAISNAFAFDNGYQTADELEVGQGYWVKFDDTFLFNVDGMAYIEPIPVSEGWNLVGPFYYDVDVAEVTTEPAGIITGNFFGYEEGYNNASTLNPGNGYWVKTSTSGLLMLPMPVVGKKGNDTEMESPNEDALYTISVATADGAAGSYELMLGIDPAATDGIDSDLGETELPPLPPAGVYDARMILPDGTTGSPADYRTGDNNYTGQVTYTMKYQLGDGGASMTLDVDIPEIPGTVTMTVQDPFGGVLVNEVVNEGGGQVVVTNTSLTELKLIVDYNAPIPVELSSFAANVVGETIQLAWETATETNNKGFEVERSEDNATFTKVGYMDGNGTTSEKQSYTFTDHHAVSGTYYYRLRQIDFDGTSSYSDAVEVDFVPTEYSLGQNYPNPFNPSTRIKFAVPVDSKVTVTLYNMLGQKVKEIVSQNYSVGLHEVDFNASELSSGMYIYSITAQGVDGSNFVDTKKMMLMK
ncbi:MAG: hypothetical protein SCALA702_24370 [Melioribacteraceae bacterium]|nr:MAG: hypothetical protein SCALA702_24370 [Melioribacteraceae bacterium]